MRIILYTGKGGVGKTTVAAATALRAAELGHRTIVMSTDAAHSLGDSLDVKLGPEPLQVAENLWAQETDVYYNLRNWWGTVQEWLTALLAWQGMAELQAEEIAILPGMEELANLLWVNRHYHSGEFDTIIVDCAPTAETLRLLSFPEAARWWVAKLLPLQRRMAQVLGPLIHPITGMPMPKKEVFDTAEELLDQLAELYGLLSTRELASSRLVVNPEKMVVRETQRTFTYLSLYGYVTDLVVANRVLTPEAAEGQFFAHWRELQQDRMRFIEEAFSPVPIISLPMMRNEVVGFDRLREVAHLAFGADDPTKLYYHRISQEIRAVNGKLVLTLGLPFVNRGEVQLAQRGDELVVRIAGQSRNILLPHSLAGRSATGARMIDDRLEVDFEKVGA